MSEVFGDYLPAILVALLVGIIVGYLIFRPRQRVRLTDNTPTRPHMANSEPRHGVASEVATATSNVAGQILDAPVQEHLGGESAGTNELQRLKGVGPKFAQILAGRGIVRYEQLARLSPDEVERLDNELGPFRGRLQRDQVIEQAAYLARGDIDGFEQRFGKL
jgi:predicted flap endonuclease-1-like 5' DNA nuclease